MNLTASVRARSAAAIEVIGPEFIRDSAATLVNRAALLLFGLATSIIVIRTLGPAGRGEYAVAVTISMIGIQLANLGLHASNTWAVSRDPSLRSALVVNSLIFSVTLGGAAAGIVALVALVAPDIFDLPPQLLVLGLAAIPVGLAYLFLQNLALGIGALRAYNLIELAIRGAGLLVLAIVAVVAMLDPTTAVGINLAIITSGFVLMLVALVRVGPTQLRPRLDLFREHLSYGIRGYLAALFSFLVLRSDIVVVQAFRGSSEAGLYSAAVTLAEVVYLGPVVIGSLLFPRLAAMTSDRVRQRRTTTALLVATIGIVATVALVVGLIAAPIVTTLFGEAFDPATSPFIWLLPGVVMLSGYTIVANYFAARGMPTIAFAAPAAGFGVNLMANLLLVPGLGMIGASLASTVAYALMLMVIVLAFRADRVGERD
jgi:O-antigen/teichoic acid export membrane protein